MTTKSAKVRLLVVDDEEDFLASISLALERRGIDVHGVISGELALAIVHEHEFDVVVLDLRMPGIDGIEVFHRLRAEKPTLPVIMLTGHGSIDHAFQTAKHGIFDFIPKPCDPDVLAQRIHAAAASAESQKPTALPDESVSRPVRLLIVDDEVELLDSLATVLSRRKMQVLTAPTGAAALEILHHSPIDVVVLDIKMPGMDGLEVLRMIKKDHPAVEVLLLTGHPTVSTAHEGIKMGAAQYLEKPPDVDELAAAIVAANQRRLDKNAAQQREVIEDLRSRPD